MCESARHPSPSAKNRLMWAQDAPEHSLKTRISCNAYIKQKHGPQGDYFLEQGNQGGQKGKSLRQEPHDLRRKQSKRHSATEINNDGQCATPRSGNWKRPWS